MDGEIQLQDIFGFLDPSVSIKQLSMAFAGTDFLHHLHFRHEGLLVWNHHLPFAHLHSLKVHFDSLFKVSM
ncbi:DUF3526 domain-containing protein [Parapedobacter koreensis]|uniref:DUF3526 domain-containing protein n=1 Tax=Parapedobacter koreensis TaxID=332977 RepID=UPI000B875D5A|nr:DUF3526 domain-containing protein [Parapedobacter koreensis]